MLAKWIESVLVPDGIPPLECASMLELCGVARLLQDAMVGKGDSVAFGEQVIRHFTYQQLAYGIVLEAKEPPCFAFASHVLSHAPFVCVLQLRA